MPVVKQIRKLFTSKTKLIAEQAGARVAGGAGAEIVSGQP